MLMSAVAPAVDSVCSPLTSVPNAMPFCDEAVSVVAVMLLSVPLASVMAPAAAVRLTSLPETVLTLRSPAVAARLTVPVVLTFSTVPPLASVIAIGPLVSVAVREAVSTPRSMPPAADRLTLLAVTGPVPLRVLPLPIHRAPPEDDAPLMTPPGTVAPPKVTLPIFKAVLLYRRTLPPAASDRLLAWVTRRPLPEPSPTAPPALMARLLATREWYSLVCVMLPPA